MVDNFDWNEAERRLAVCVKRGLPEACWLAAGKPTSRGYGQRGGWGYGQVGVGSRKKGKRRNFQAHRLAFQLHWGVILPRRLHVCHDCPDGDNKMCCNPAHLFISDSKGHGVDRAAKGQMICGDQHWTRLHPEKVARGEQSWSRNNLERLARGERNGAHTKPDRRPRGERHGQAKLNEAKVAYIRVCLASGGMSRQWLAALFGVDVSTIGLIARNKIWKVSADDLSAMLRPKGE